MPALSNIWSAGLTLLAFVLALYALAAREQKTPYITNSIFDTPLIVLGAILLSAMGEYLLVSGTRSRRVVDSLALLLLGIAILTVVYRVWNVRHRKLNFRDDEMLKSLRIVRQGKAVWRRIGGRSTYEHDPIGLHGPLLDSIRALPSLQGVPLNAAIERWDGLDEKLVLSLSLGCRVGTHAQADRLLTELALPFLRQECWVQYIGCSRHPIEFILQLKRFCEKNQMPFQEQALRIVAVDAYSPHFGFTDSIHDEMNRRLRALRVTCESATASYPSLHGATARSFNHIQKRMKASGRSVRRPTLLIYDGPSAIADVESMEQYRIFIRHLIPSERLWGGMFTVVTEAAIQEEPLKLLAAYTDVFIDLTAPSPKVADSVHGQ